MKLGCWKLSSLIHGRGERGNVKKPLQVGRISLRAQLCNELWQLNKLLLLGDIVAVVN